MALLLILLALLGFGFVGAGSGSGTSHSSPKVFPAQKTRPHHHVRCSARMKARPSAGGNERCGGPPANP